MKMCLETLAKAISCEHEEAKQTYGTNARGWLRFFFIEAINLEWIIDINPPIHLYLFGESSIPVTR